MYNALNSTCIDFYHSLENIMHIINCNILVSDFSTSTPPSYGPVKFFNGRLIVEFDKETTVCYAFLGIVIQ